MSTETIDMAPTEEQLEGWRRAAGARPLGEWLAELADAAVLEGGVEPAAARTWPVVVALRHPVAHGGNPISQLTIQRGTLGLLKGLRLPAAKDAVSVDLFITVASRLTGQPTQVIEALDSEDSGEVLAHAKDFLARVLGGGRTR